MSRLVVFLFAAIAFGNCLPIDDPGQPLYLTPLINSGQIHQAKQMAMVEPLVPGVSSSSGYITVDNTTDANMFFWKVDTNRNGGKAPLILWLQGGPGASSMFGLFAEMGPFQVDENLKVSHRVAAWTHMYNMVFIDNPVGTGFSFVKDPSGYRTDEDGVADHLYKFFVQFFKLYPELMSQPFYIAGESYGGKYIPSLAQKLVQMELFLKSKGMALETAKLSGVMVGNGLSDPETVSLFLFIFQFIAFVLMFLPQMFAPSGDHLYNLGLLDETQREYFNSEVQQAIKYIQTKQFGKAFEVFDYLINADFYPYPSYFQNASGCTDYFNFLLCKVRF